MYSFSFEGIIIIISINIKHGYVIHTYASNIITSYSPNKVLMADDSDGKVLTKYLFNYFEVTIFYVF